MAKRPVTKKVIVEQGKSAGRGSSRPRRQPPAPVIPSLVPPGKRKQKGSIRVDAGAAPTSRGRVRRPPTRINPPGGSPIVRAPQKI